MKPPYDITPKILTLVQAISEKIGEVKANYLGKPTFDKGIQMGKLNVYLIQ